MKSFIFVLIALGAPSFAQEPELTPPPMPPPVDEPGVLQPPVVSNAPLEAPLPERGNRILRVGVALAAGAASGTALAVVGGFVLPVAIAPLRRGWAGGALGFALGAPIGVLVASWLLDGAGAWWACLLGDVAGLAAGAVATWLGGAEGLPLMFALPLAGAVLGYEVSAPVTPTVSIGPGGAQFGIAGRF